MIKRERILTVSSIGEDDRAMAGLALLGDRVNLHVATEVRDLALFQQALESFVSGSGGQARHPQDQLSS
jgi:hypothetical protein